MLRGAGWRGKGGTGRVELDKGSGKREGGKMRPVELDEGLARGVVGAQHPELGEEVCHLRVRACTRACLRRSPAAHAMYGLCCAQRGNVRVGRRGTSFSEVSVGRPST